MLTLRCNIDNLEAQVDRCKSRIPERSDAVRMWSVGSTYICAHAEYVERGLKRKGDKTVLTQNERAASRIPFLHDALVPRRDKSLCRMKTGFINHSSEYVVRPYPGTDQKVIAQA